MLQISWLLFQLNYSSRFKICLRSNKNKATKSSKQTPHLSLCRWTVCIYPDKDVFMEKIPHQLLIVKPPILFIFLLEHKRKKMGDLSNFFYKQNKPLCYFLWALSVDLSFGIFPLSKGEDEDKKKSPLFQTSNKPFTAKIHSLYLTYIFRFKVKTPTPIHN